MASASEAVSDSTDSSLERVFVYAAYGIVVGLCLSKVRDMRTVLPFAGPLLMLAGIALFSVLWSQVPINSLRCAVYYTFDTLLAIYLLAVYSLEEIMSLIMMTGVIVGILSILTVILFPQYGIVHLPDHAGVWQGVFSEKNDAAKNMMFLLTPILGRRLLEWKGLLYGVLLLPLIAMTGSKSALVAALIMVVFSLVQRMITKLSRKTAAFATSILVVCGFACGALLVFAGSQITALLGRDITLTGRTDIWTLLVESAMRKPWLGYGYAAFWTGLDGESGRIYDTLHWIFTYAHNGVLEIWLQLGLIGVAVVLYALARAVRDACLVARHHASVGVQWLISLVVLTIVYNLDEGTILFTRSFVSMIFVLTCTGLAQAEARCSVWQAKQPVTHQGYRLDRVAHA